MCRSFSQEFLEITCLLKAHTPGPFSAGVSLLSQQNWEQGIVEFHWNEHPRGDLGTLMSGKY